MVYDCLSHMKYCIVKGKEETLFVSKCITVLRTWSSTVTQTLWGDIQKPETAKRTMHFEEERKKGIFWRQELQNSYEHLFWNYIAYWANGRKKCFKSFDLDQVVWNCSTMKFLFSLCTVLETTVTLEHFHSSPCIYRSWKPLAFYTLILYTFRVWCGEWVYLIMQKQCGNRQTCVWNRDHFFSWAK